MPAYCVVSNCFSNSSKTVGISYFRFPSLIGQNKKSSPLREERLNKWIAALHRNDFTIKKARYSRICSKHFHSGKPSPLSKQDDPDWVPTLKMGRNRYAPKSLNGFRGYEDTVECSMDEPDQKQIETSNLSRNFICAVPGCEPKGTGGSIEFFPFPESKSNLLKWVSFCGLYDIKSPAEWICSRHFAESAYITEVKQFGSLTCIIRKLHPDAVPTIKYVTNESFTSVSHQNGEENSIVEDQPIVEEHPIVKEEKLIVEENSVSEKKDPLDIQTYNSIKTWEDLKRLKIANQKLIQKIKNTENSLLIKKKLIKEKEQCLKKAKTDICGEKKIVSREILSKVFSKQQIKMICGHKKKVHWTEDDLAVGFTIRHLSNRKCYDYLTNTLKYPLPGFSSIKRYITNRKNQMDKDDKI